MTKSSAEILGLPVISITEGRELGISKTLVVDARRGAVAAITIEDEDWYRGVKLLPYTSVIAIGKDAVTVTSSESILTLEEASDFEAMLDANVRIIGTKAITKTGTIDGKVKEVFIDGEGVVEKILIVTPDGVESEIMSDEISIFGKQVTVVGEPGDGVERKREAEHFTYTHQPKPKAVPEPKPEPVIEAAPEIAPEMPAPFAAMEEPTQEPEPIEEAEPGAAAEPSENPAQESMPQTAEAAAIEIQPEPVMPAVEVAPSPEPELPEVIEPEIAPEFMGSLVSETVSEPEPVKEAAPELVPEPVENLVTEVVSEPEPEPEPVKEAEAEILPETAENLVTEVVSEPEPIETAEPEIVPESVESPVAEVEPRPAAEPVETTMPEIVPEQTEPVAVETESVLEPALSEAPKPEPVPEPTQEEIPAPAPEPKEEPAPKPKTRRGRPKKAAKPASESEEEPAPKPKTRRGRPKKAAAAEPAEALVLELETEPEPKKKSAARTRKKAAAEPESPEAAAKSTMNRQRRFLLGKKAARDIAASSGVVIAKAGDEITEEIMEKAQQTGKLIELSMNAQ